MRKVCSVVIVCACAAFAHATPAPLRVTVVSLRDAGHQGALIADELADRLALVSNFAVADREHVREAERALRVEGTDELPTLVAVGKRLGAEMVIGGAVQGSRAAIQLVTPSTGDVVRLDAGGGPRADRLAIAIAKAVIEKQRPALSELARASIETVDGKGDDAAFALYAQGRELLAAGQAREALAKMQQAVTRDDKLAGARAFAALALLRLKDLAGAEKPARDALERAAASREARLVAARVEDHRDHVDAAIEAYRAVIEIVPHDAIAHSNLARLLAVKRHDHVAAAREYEAALAAEPTWSLPRFNLALSELALGQPAKAIERLQRLHQDDPQAVEYTFTLARAYRLAERASAAEPLLRRIVTDRPADLGARAELALTLAASDRSADALALLDQAPQPAELILRTARARVLLAREDRNGAARALEAIPADAATAARHAALRTLGVIELARGNLDAASRALRPVVDEDPLDAEALYDLGLVQRRAVRPEAIETLLRAHRAAPTLVPAAVALAQAQLDAGDARAAQTVLDETVAAGSSDRRIDYLLGLARWKSGSLDEAIAAFNRASEDAAEVGGDATYALAECLLAAGRVDSSRDAAARYLAREHRKNRETQLGRARLLAH